ncbi:MAG: hypothetical protein B7Z14_08615 [Bosea sp. 32-68-6]|nr:MAG: hypothetical protein B7Z14_08615 [Bosea sp. 32-68-6]
MTEGRELQAFLTNVGAAAIPSADDVTAALERLVASETLRGSSQLVTFLRFVVTATIEGRQSSLKAYTIAVDGLRRPKSYDPQTDSGVRVLAGRLRRALQQYYREEGADDPVVIELPRGGYVPTFRFRAAGEASAPAALDVASVELEPAAPDETLPPTPVRPAGRARPTLRVRARSWGLGLGLVAVLCVIASLAMSTLFWPTQSLPRPYDGVLWPTLLVLPFEGGGQTVDGVLDVERFRSRLTDAISRFDSVAVIAAAPGETYPKAEYRISGTAETRADGSVVMRVRLVDAADGTLVLSRDLIGTRRTGEDGEVEERGLQKFAALVADPFGAVWSRDAAFYADERGPVRGCVLKMLQYWRTFDMSQHEPVRSCLLSALAEHPGLTSIHASLVLVHYRDHIMDIVPPDGVPPLDAALAVARRAVTSA